MKYVPKQISQNQNVSETQPFRAFLRLAVALFAVLAVFYVVTGFIVDTIADSYPETVEKYIAPIAHVVLRASEEDENLKQRVQPIFDKLVAALPASERSRTYTLHVSSSSDVNAIALPGGHVVIFAGLLRRIRSETELAMVLGHELGHFANHDHMRGLGRGLALVLATSVIFGADSGATNLFGGSIDFMSKSFSRKQEEQADAFGQDLVQSVYGHVGGATDFFEKLQTEDPDFSLLRFGLTHPLSRDRVRKLKQRAQEKGYRMEVGPELTF